jgi:hypothetical protein
MPKKKKEKPKGLIEYARELEAKRAAAEPKDRPKTLFELAKKNGLHGPRDSSEEDMTLEQALEQAGDDEELKEVYRSFYTALEKKA